MTELLDRAPEIIAIILGGGGIASTITSVVQARRAVREGARLDERGVITDSEQWRRSADDARKEAEAEADWWRDRAIATYLACVEHGGHPERLGSPPWPH